MSVLEMDDIWYQPYYIVVYFWVSQLFPNLYIIQEGELAFWFHSCSFPGPKPATIINGLGVTVDVFCYDHFILL